MNTDEETTLVDLTECEVDNFVDMEDEERDTLIMKCAPVSDPIFSESSERV